MGLIQATTVPTCTLHSIPTTWGLGCISSRLGYGPDPAVHNNDVLPYSHSGRNTGTTLKRNSSIGEAIS